uniref:Uncharacterized protein n=1 Tax=Aegilops tauschii subsp. strangulata TaxID=200361 RepID=A0A452ZKA3_AEGTS
MDALYQNDHQFLAIDGASKLKMILPAHSVFRCIICMFSFLFCFVYLWLHFIENLASTRSS